MIENRPEEVQFLLKEGHDPRKPNRHGLTPLEIARYLGRKKCEDLIKPLPKKEIFIQLKGKNSLLPLTPNQLPDILNISYFRTLRFRSYETLKFVIESCPYLLRIKSLDNAKWGKRYAPELDLGAIIPCSIRWVDETIQYGMFAERDIEEGEWIGEYTGDVRQYLRSNPDQNPYCLHYPTRFWSLHYFMVDALRGGNETRFANHSDQPNMVPKCLACNRLLHTVFFASKKIKKGDELTFDYGKDFWQKREKIPH